MKAKWGIERNVDKNIHKGKFNKVNINGISLIVLVITIIDDRERFNKSANQAAQKSPKKKKTIRNRHAKKS